jgi:hypothetical protein
MTWLPFEDRPRPDADLAKARLALDRGQRIEITVADDDAAVGRIFAWLMGQVRLARQIEDERQAEDGDGS